MKRITLLLALAVLAWPVARAAAGDKARRGSAPARQRLVGPDTDRLNATDVIWEFFGKIKR